MDLIHENIIREPHPIQIIDVHDVHQFILNEEALQKILFDPRIKNKKVVVLSIAGAFRKGKSFLLNLFLKYLQVPDKKSNDWLTADDSSLSGFNWRGGSERETTGILMWSEPFIVKIPSSNEEVAILIMDTQGAFDSQSTVKDCATVFALSTMLSSIQLFNLIQNIQEDDLQHLQLFTEYGRLASEDYSNKPFQHLMFLIRDWSYPYEYPYGLNGGNKLLEKRLEIRDNQHSELQQIRQHIKTCFDKLDCFLLPHPGLNVATSPSFNGRIQDIQPEFIEYVKILAPLLLSPPNLIVKEINGNQITGKELYEYFKAYIKIYQGDELPEPKTMLLATAEANNLTALSNSKDRYMQLMDELCGSDKPYVNSHLVEKEDSISRRKALLLFRGTKKMGGPEFSKVYEEKLVHEIADIYRNYVNNNEAKNVFSAGKTPFVLICLIAILYVISTLFGLIGIRTIATMANYGMGTLLVLLAVWIYSRVNSNSLNAMGGSTFYTSETVNERSISPSSSSNMRTENPVLSLSSDSKSAVHINANRSPSPIKPGENLVIELSRGIDVFANSVWDTLFCEWIAAALQHPSMNNVNQLLNIANITTNSNNTSKATSSNNIKRSERTTNTSSSHNLTHPKTQSGKHQAHSTNNNHFNKIQSSHH